MKKIFVTGLFFTGILVSSCNDNAKIDTDSKEVAKEQNEAKFDEKPMEEDAKFAVAAADGGMLEVKLAQLALTKATASSVKQFAQMMIDDHSQANAELKSLAVSKSISLPDSLSDKRREQYDDFTNKKGADFDKAYTAFMVDDHKADIDAFKKEAEKGNDATIKSWAAGKVPTLEHHLQMAQSANESVGKK